MNQSLRSVSQAISDVPTQFAHWVNTMNDASFVQLMFLGAVLLTFVIARALR